MGEGWSDVFALVTEQVDKTVPDGVFGVSGRQPPRNLVDVDILLFS